MGRVLVYTVLLSCILSGPASVAASTETASTIDIDQINQGLRGKVAAIELLDGKTVRKAKKVVIESNFTYWRAKGKEQKVETDKIVRITARSKSGGWIGLGAGAGVGLLSMAATASSADEMEGLVLAANGGALVLGVLATSAIGYGIDKAIPRQSRVVYEVGSAGSTTTPTKKAKKSKRRAEPV